MTEEKNLPEKSVQKEKVKVGKMKTDNAGLVRFLKETIIELKKVVWPTKRQLVINTVIVILASILMALFIGFFDQVFAQIDKLIVKG